MNKARFPKILAIDDETAVRESIRNYLEDYGFELLEAEDGRSGLELFQKHQPDLVLVDLRLPGIDGLAVLEKVNGSAPDTPVIVVSGTGMISDVVEALRRGAWNFVLKPIEDMTVLRHAVDAALERARLMAENTRHQKYLEELVVARTRALQHSNRQLEQANRQLRQSEEKYRIVFDTMLHGFSLQEPVYDESGRLVDLRFTEVNPAFERITGLDAKTCAGKTVRDIFPNAGARWLAGHGSDNGQERSNRFEHRSLELDRDFDITTYNTGTGHFVTILDDITDKKQLEMQLGRAQKLEAIGTLAGGIAHDFNNILSGVLGYAELALLDIAKTHPARAKVEQVLHSGQRARELVKQILSFSRRDNPEKTPVHVHLMVKEVLKLLRAALPTTIEIRQQLDTSETTVMADPTQIHQIVMNLCTNAHHAMRENGGRLTLNLQPVTLTAADIDGLRLELTEGRYLRLDVIDTGHGIEKDHLDRIFDPYFTTKKKGEGTGLGLSVVHGIVTGLKGAVVVDSKAGQGTTFSVFLPLVRTGRSKTRSDAGYAAAGGSGRILLVDDEEVLVDICRQMLEKMGYTVVGLTDPRQAISVFTPDPGAFDLVITDMTMPHMTGDQLAAALKETRLDIPIIICTGYNDRMTEAIAKEKGFTGYLMKPVAFQDLSRTVRRALHHTTP